MTRRGVYRSIYSMIFDDGDYQKLTTRERLVLITARQCHSAGPAAIFRYYASVLADQVGCTPAQVKEALAALAAGGWVVFDDTVLWVRNGLRYEPTMTLANPKHRVAIADWLAALPKTEVVVQCCHYYRIPCPFDVASIPSPIDKLGSDASALDAPNGHGGNPEWPAEHGATGWGTVEALADLYNNSVPSSLPRVSKLTPNRRKKARTSLAAFPERDFWVTVCAEIARSSFLQGLRPSHGHENFKATFDWLLTKGKDGTENAVKVYEGKYRDKGMTDPLEDDDDDGAA